MVAWFGVDNVGASSFRLEWEPPKDENGRISYGYTIKNALSDHPSETIKLDQTSLVKIRGILQYNVGSLLGDTTYRVSVFAYNIKLNVNGPSSRTEEIHTLTGSEYA